MFKGLYISIIALLFCSVNLSAQINPLAAQYFQNKYLGNPAMAGIKQGTHLNLGYRNQWSNIQGSPQNLSVTGEYGSEKVGAGINFYKDEAGLLSRSKIQGTYAYHLPLNNDQKSLHFGVSLGLQTNTLNLQGLVGSPNDLTAIRFNDQERIIDGDFGLAYSDEHFILEGSFSNLKNQLQIEDNEITNYATYMAAMTYKLKLSDFQVQSKLVYRGVKNFDDILDLGFEIRTPDNQLGFMSMYHTNKSMSFGLSYERLKQWQLLMLYNTPTQAIKSYSTGTFELGLQLDLGTVFKSTKAKK
jgi:type IX secretion system PorP/SprF family membrane protein